MREFEEIYAEYCSLVFKYALSLCQNRTLAEEITQETFFRALKGIGKFKGQCKMSSWLCQIAKNCYCRYSRREKKGNLQLQEDFPDAASFEQALDDRETGYAIHHILHRLREPYKEVFWLKTFGELNFAKIAELFDKSESWARVTYYRAKMMIREELE